GTSLTSTPSPKSLARPRPRATAPFTPPCRRPRTGRCRPLTAPRRSRATWLTSALARARPAPRLRQRTTRRGRVEADRFQQLRDLPRRQVAPGTERDAPDMDRPDPRPR